MKGPGLADEGNLYGWDPLEFGGVALQSRLRSRLRYVEKAKGSLEGIERGRAELEKKYLEGRLHTHRRFTEGSLDGALARRDFLEARLEEHVQLEQRHSEELRSSVVGDLRGLDGWEQGGEIEVRARALLVEHPEALKVELAQKIPPGFNWDKHAKTLQDLQSDVDEPFDLSQLRREVAIVKDETTVRSLRDSLAGVSMENRSVPDIKGLVARGTENLREGSPDRLVDTYRAYHRTRDRVLDSQRLSEGLGKRLDLEGTPALDSSVSGELKRRFSEAHRDLLGELAVADQRVRVQGLEGRSVRIRQAFQIGSPDEARDALARVKRGLDSMRQGGGPVSQIQGIVGGLSRGSMRASGQLLNQLKKRVGPTLFNAALLPSQVGPVGQALRMATTSKLKGG